MRQAWTLALLATGLVQEAPEARARFDELMKGWTAAQAVEFEVHTLSEGVAEDTGEAWTTRLGSEGRWALPMAGRCTHRTEGDPTQIEVLGDGEQVFVKQAETGYIPFGEDRGLLSMVLPACSLAPFQAWLGRDRAQPNAVTFAAARAGLPLLEGLRLAFDDRTEVLWVDPAGGLVAATVEPADPQGELRRQHFQFTHLAWVAEADAAAYAAEIPADAIEENPMAQVEKSLLAVGDTIPDLTLTGLDGREIRVADLRGKTLLFNFWFYH